MSTKSIVHYLYEAYHLKSFEHCGTKLVHVPNPDSLAEHVLLATQIAYFLADLERADRAKVIEMILFHDNGEVRIGDINKLQASYLTNKSIAELEAVSDQTQSLPKEMREQIRSNFQEMEDKETLEAKVVKDADLLEQVFQIKIFMMQGNYDGLELWLKNVEKNLKTKSAKKIYKEAMNTSPNQWLKQIRKQKGI